MELRDPGEGEKWVHAHASISPDQSWLSGSFALPCGPLLKVLVCAYVVSTHSRRVDSCVVYAASEFVMTSSTAHE